MTINLSLRNAQGHEVLLNSLWQDSTVAFYFLRHIG